MQAQTPSSILIVYFQMSKYVPRDPKGLLKWMTESMNLIFIKIFLFLQLPNTYLNSTFEELSYYITQPCTTDMERVRAIFSWLTSFDVPKLLKDVKDTPMEGSPLEYLGKIKKKKGNKAFMFAYLCLYVDVHTLD